MVVSAITVFGLLIGVCIVLVILLFLWIRHQARTAEKRSDAHEPAPRVSFEMIDTNADLLIGFSCYVCLDDLPHTGNVVRLHCGHHYHRRCINQWLNTSRAHECPSCRARVPRKGGEQSNGDVVLDIGEGVPQDVPAALVVDS